MAAKPGPPETFLSGLVHEAAGGPVSTRDLHDGEDGSGRRPGPRAIARERARYCAWPGTAEPETPGRLGRTLAAERAPHQRFFSAQGIDSRLEQLSCAALLE